ncbi:MAG: sel1 repeat family protein [Erythrobacter sp.]|uniref:hypothetical protein n=1 Tax=Erythrobacter sp. TaxID=1042 RepID=UPI001B2974DE|nr:hypothetical protein [Erythrobacter sp.]MBO6768105.1 sel1 repeat family protein [Erythrobacter sp.]
MNPTRTLSEFALRWLRQYWSPKTILRESIHDFSLNWEREYSKPWDRRIARCPDETDRLQLARAVFPKKPTRSFEIYREAAAEGSAWSMWVVGWFYEQGIVVDRNLGQACKSFAGAIDSGFMRARKSYADVHFDAGNMTQVESVLQPAIGEGYIPACYWLASYRLRQQDYGGPYEAIEPLLVSAATEGHPLAIKTLSWLLMRGRLGFRRIPEGVRAHLALQSVYYAGQKQPPNPAA